MNDSFFPFNERQSFHLLQQRHSKYSNISLNINKRRGYPHQNTHFLPLLLALNYFHQLKRAHQTQAFPAAQSQRKIAAFDNANNFPRSLWKYVGRKEHSAKFFGKLDVVVLVRRFDGWCWIFCQRARFLETRNSTWIRSNYRREVDTVQIPNFDIFGRKPAFF